MAKRVKKAEKPDADARKEMPTHVYVATCDGRTKIGIADNVTIRMRQLQNGAGAAVRLKGSRQFSTRLSAESVERRLHRRYHAGRLHGEWFTTDPDRVLAALSECADPELHTDLWTPGMPSNVATGDYYDRWKWMRDNSMLSLSEMIRIWGRIEGKRRFLAQQPKPALPLSEVVAIQRRADATLAQWTAKAEARRALKAARQPVAVSARSGS